MKTCWNCFNSDYKGDNILKCRKGFETSMTEPVDGTARIHCNCWEKDPTIRHDFAPWLNLCKCKDCTVEKYNPRHEYVPTE